MFKAIGFIGAGNMATAIIDGMLRNSFLSPDSLYIFDLDSEKMALMKAKGINTEQSGKAVADKCDIIVLAVKPQNYREVLSDIKEAVTDKKVFVSIAAGISTSYVQSELSASCPVVRVMPNTPLLLGKGATALCATENIGKDDFKTVYDMFSLSGTVEILKEDHMNEIISVNGSSPAYVYLFAKAMLDYATQQGIDEKAALNLICATLEGSAEMLRESGSTPDELIEKVSSKGGTTIAALETLRKFNFYEGIKDAMSACTKRAEELGK